MLQDKALAPIGPDSDEFLMLEHYLRLCSRTSRVKVTHAWRVTMGHSSLLTHSRKFGKQRIFSWVDPNSQTERNALQNVIRRGFIVPGQGLKFSIGNLDLPGMPLPLTYLDIQRMHDVFPVGERRRFQLILCEVGKLMLNRE